MVGEWHTVMQWGEDGEILAWEKDPHLPPPGKGEEQITVKLR
jgi:hypothetical protein